MGIAYAQIHTPEIRGVGLESEVQFYVYEVVVVLLFISNLNTTVVHARILQVHFQVLREEVVQTAFYLVH